MPPSKNRSKICPVRSSVSFRFSTLHFFKVGHPGSNHNLLHNRVKKCGDSEAATGGVVKKLFSEISQNSQENMFFWKGLRPTTLLKKTLWHMCFPVNFTKFRRTHLLQNNSRRLLLEMPFLSRVTFNNVAFKTG